MVFSAGEAFIIAMVVEMKSRNTDSTEVRQNAVSDNQK